jgi:hypothetical protein
VLAAHTICGVKTKRLDLDVWKPVKNVSCYTYLIADKGDPDVGEDQIRLADQYFLYLLLLSVSQTLASSQLTMRSSS